MSDGVGDVRFRVGLAYARDTSPATPPRARLVEALTLPRDGKERGASVFGRALGIGSRFVRDECGFGAVVTNWTKGALWNL